MTTVAEKPQLFTVRPATVEAWQWDGSAEVADLIVDWVIDSGGPLDTYLHPYENLIVLGKTTQIAPAKSGDWIVHDSFGDFWPMDEKLFPGAYSQLVRQ